VASETKVEILSFSVPLLVVLIFSGAVFNGFVNWDDQHYFTGNTSLQMEWLDALHWCVTTWWQRVYQPVSWILLLIQAKTLGTDPAILHVVSLVLHAANSWLAYRLARSFGLYAIPSALAALLLGIHPLRVETVVWASAQPYLWAAFFSLLATLFAVHKKPFFWVTVLFTLAILCKATPVTLPLVWMLIGVKWNRWQWLVLLTISATVGIVSFFAGQDSSSAELIRMHTWGTHVHQVLFALGLSVEKFFSPTNLSAYYPSGLPSGIGTAAVGALWLLAAFSFWAQKPKIARWLFVIPALILPHLLWLRVGQTLTADRYSYIALWGWVPALAWLLGQVDLKGSRWFSAAVCIFLSVLTYEQILLWGNSRANWKSTLASGASSTSISRNTQELEQGRRRRLRQAEVYLRQAIRIKPDYAVAYHNLGVVLLQAQRYSEALWPLLRAQEIDSELANLDRNLGVAYAGIGQLNRAREHFSEALRLNPQDRVTRANLEKLNPTD